METTQIVDESLRKVTKGAGIILLGTVLGLGLAFVSKIIVIRYITLDEYGVFSLALVLIGVFGSLALLGLEGGATRYIAFFRGKGDEEKVRGTILSSIQIALVASLSFAVIAFFASDLIATNIFHMEELSKPLKILSVAIPFSVLIAIFTSIFRGYDRADVRLYFNDILRNVLYLVFLGFAILWGLSLLRVVYASVAAAVISCIAFAVYAMRRPPLPIKKQSSAILIRKELLFFSLPLLTLGMFLLIMTWTDTLMLGYFKSPDAVGLYNGALPLAQLIPLPLGAMGFLFLPVISSLYSRDLTEEIGRNYKVVTKWIFSASLPVFLVLCLFPEVTLSFLFGSQYAEAASALRFLSLGFLFHTFLGPAGLTLMGAGKTRLLMWISLFGAVLNVILNSALIPRLGIEGAAIASMISYFAVCASCSAKLYQLYRIHPFTKNYLKPIVASGIIILALYAIAKNLLLVTYWMLPLFVILFLVVYAVSLLLTKSFDREDIMILLSIEQRTGIDATVVKNILRRFL